MKSTVLITGGAGFVGSSIALDLKEKNKFSQIVCLDNLIRRGSEFNVPRLEKAGIRFLHGDVRKPEDLDLAGISPDVIIECSAEPSVLAGYGESPRYVIESNLFGAVNCLELARRHNSIFIFLSSSRIYPYTTLCGLKYDETTTRFVPIVNKNIPGLSGKGISEGFPLDGLRSIYGSTKLSAELVIREYAAAYGLKTIINRCGVITGPWQMGKVDQGIFVYWMASHLLNKPLQYIGFDGKGKQVRDFLHCRDLCELILQQLDTIDTVYNETYNVGGGTECSLSLFETTELCREITGNRVAIKKIRKNRPADIPWYITDNSKIHSQTKWKPHSRAKETLVDIYTWLKENTSIVNNIFNS